MHTRILILLTGVALGAGIYVQAQEVRRDVYRFEHVGDAMGEKFGRGLVNVLTGLGEFPRQFARTPRTEVRWVRWPVALGKGAVMSVIRTGVGAVETCLFFVPTGLASSPRGPQVYDYGPILYPSYVWTNDAPGQVALPAALAANAPAAASVGE